MRGGARDVGHLPAAAREMAERGGRAEQAGHPREALLMYEAALRSLPADAEGASAVTLVRWIAWLHAKLGDSRAALDCLEVARVACEARGDTRGLASTLNTRAGTLFNLGELDPAEALFGRVRELAWKLGDRKLQAMADQNLGAVSCIRGDLRLALERFQDSLAGYEALGLREYVAPLLNNIGRLQTELGETDDARESLERARVLCLGRGDHHHHVVVEVNRARLLLGTNRLGAALRAGDSALRLARLAGDERWLADIHLVIGTARQRMGSPEEALEELRLAEEIARERGDAKVLADAVMEQAGVLRELGDNPGTLERLNEAHRIFRRLRARRDLADVDARLDDLERTFLGIVREWGESIESKDAYTQGHCSRVAAIACMLAEASGLPAEEMSWFRMGALLHDVGKVSVPLEILNKPGRLTDEEFDVMATHPEAGVALLESVEFPWDIRPMIRHHHERWDGSGYPWGLSGTDIPRAARILTVADVYDALTTDRSYRKGFSHDRAMEIMRSESGTTFEPALLALFEAEVAPELAAREAAGERAPATRVPVARNGGEAAA